MRDARDKNKADDEKRKVMIASVAHDLKTPLTSVIGYLTLLQEEPDLSPEFRARYTGIALDKARRKSVGRHGR